MTTRRPILSILSLSLLLCPTACDVEVHPPRAPAPAAAPQPIHIALQLPELARTDVMRGALAINTDYLSMTPRLAPALPGRGVLYTDSQTGRLRFLDTQGGSIEAGTADRVQTLSSAPTVPSEGRFYGNTSTHQLFYYDGTSFKALATAAGTVPGTRQILCGNGLTGCGDLSADRSLAVLLAATPGLQFSGGALAFLPKPSGGLAADGSGAYVTWSAPGAIGSGTPAAVTGTTVTATTQFTGPGTGLTGIPAGTALSGQVPIANGGTGAATTSQGYVFAGPVGGGGAPAFRALVASDLSAAITGSAVCFSLSASTSLAAGDFWGAAADADAAAAMVAPWVAPCDGKLQRLRVQSNSASAGAAVLTVHRSAGGGTISYSATSITCTASTAKFCSDTSNSYAATGGDAFVLQLTGAAWSGGAMSACFQFACSSS